MSPHQRALSSAASAVKSRRIRSAAGRGGRVGDGGLVPPLRRPTGRPGGAHEPRDALAASAGGPGRRSSACTRGAPYVPPDSSCIARIAASQLASSRSRWDGPALRCS